MLTPGPNIAIGPGGDVLFGALENFSNAIIGRVSATGAYKRYVLPSSASRPTPPTVAYGADGNIWFTDGGANAIGRLSPDGSVKEFPVPHPGSLFAFGSPLGSSAVRSRDGSIWFFGNFLSNSSFAGSLLHVHLDGTVDNYTYPANEVFSISTGPDYNIWFSAYSGTVARIASGGVIQQVVQPPFSDPPLQMTDGPDHAVWGGINPVTRTGEGGQQSTFPLPLTRFGDAPSVAGITDGGDANLWMTLYTFIDPTNTALGYRTAGIGIMAQTGHFEQCALDPAKLLYIGTIVTGRDGNLWYLDQDASSRTQINEFLVRS